MCEIEFRVWDSRKKSYFNKKDIAIDNLGNIFVFEVCLWGLILIRWKLSVVSTKTLS